MQRNKLHQSFSTQAILVSRIKSLQLLVFIGFVDNNRLSTV